MVLFWKTAAGIIIAVILILTVEKQERDLSMMLSLITCVMAGLAAFTIWEPVLDFMYRIAEVGNFQSESLKVMLKITGIGIVTELIKHVCSDSGNSALAHGVQFLGSATILMLSLPIMETLLELIQMILGGI